MHRTDISRSAIDRERWQIKKENTRLNIGAAFQQWRELKEREELESDAEVVLFLFKR